MRLRRFLYDAYHRVDTSQRVRFFHSMNERSQRNLLVRMVWTKGVLRYHYLHGHKRGLTLEVTDRCNLKCTYCPKSLDIGVRGAHMNWDLLVAAVEGSLRFDAPEVVNLVGFGAVEYIKQRIPGCRVNITTNGTLLDEEKGSALLDAGLDQISISVNATSRDQYARINATDKYDRVVKNTRAFLTEATRRRASIQVFVQVLDTINSPEQVESFRRAWEPYLGRVGTIQVQPFVNWAGLISVDELLESEREAEQKQHPPEPGPPTRTEITYIGLPTMSPRAHDQKAPTSTPVVPDAGGSEGDSLTGLPSRAGPPAYPCYHLHKSRIVSREGNALACCMVFPEAQGDLELGNLGTSAYEDLYGGQQLKDLRRLDLDGRLGELSPCNSCDAWKTVPNIWWRNPFHGVVGPKWL